MGGGAGDSSARCGGGGVAVSGAGKAYVEFTAGPLGVLRGAEQPQVSAAYRRKERKNFPKQLPGLEC